MTNYTFKDILIESEINDVKKLLALNNLSYEPRVTKTIGLYDQKKIVATGSIDHNVIKMIAVHPDYISLNLSSKILSYLLFHIEANQIEHYFLFTKPSNQKIFRNFNFKKIIETTDIVLYENNESDITKTLYMHKKNLPTKKGTRGCIVMNLNPMTLGHLFLIEQASKNETDLILFLVETNASKIDFKTRLDILKKSVLHLNNVYILPSTDYMISRATFPTYFLKDEEGSKAYTHLDISIFKKYFLPIFEIDTRYVGDEELDPLTNLYNKTMKDILDDQLIVIKRKTFNNNIISASYVRKLAKAKKFNEIKDIVPKETYKFLISKKGRSLFNE